MPSPEARVRIGSCEVLLVGTIAGFVPDGARVAQAFERHAPDLVALGVPKEDLASLEGLWKSAEAKAELVEPDLGGEHLLKLLSRFGATSIPSPDLEAAFGLAKEKGLPVESLDLDDEAHAAEYVKRVKVRHLWWAPRREKRLLRDEFPQAQDAYDLAQRWDVEVNASKPLREMEELREAEMARRLRQSAAKARRILAVVPSVRLDGVVRRLREEADA